MKFKLYSFIIISFIIYSLACNLIYSRYLDVQISLDTDENETNFSVTSGVGLAICQKSSSIIVTSHLFYNILKEKNSGNRNFTPFSDREWDIYQTNDKEFYLLIAKDNIKKIFDKEFTPEFRYKYNILKSSDKISYTERETLLGFRIDSEDILRKITISQFNSDEKIEAIKHNYKSIDLESLYQMFIIGTDEIFALLNIILNGHGWYPSKVSKNMSTNDLIRKFDYLGIRLVGLKNNQFTELIQFFIREIKVNFLYYLTCYAGDINLIIPYGSAIEKINGNIIGLLKPNFIVAVGALTNDTVYANRKFALKNCIDKLEIPKDQVDYKLFFETLHKYEKPNSSVPTKYKYNELQEILSAITPRFRPDNDPHGISALPSVMYPGTDTFVALPLDDKTAVITNVIVRKYQLEPEKEPLILNDKEVILIYPPEIPIDLHINVPDRTLPPSIVSKIPGISLIKIDKIETNINFYDFISISLGSVKPIFNKYFYIKELTIKNSGRNKLYKYSENPIELNDVLILLKRSAKLKDFPEIKIIYIGPDNIINLYEYDNKTQQRKFRLEPQNYSENNFINSMYNYFYLLPAKDEIRQKFEFDLLKKLFSSDELMELDREVIQSLPSWLFANYPSLLTNQKQKNKALFNLLIAGTMENISTIINLGANVNSLDENGNTPLMIAAYLGLEDEVRLLLSNKATPQIKDKSDQDALYWAKLGGHKKIAELIEKKLKLPIVPPKPLAYRKASRV